MEFAWHSKGEVVGPGVQNYWSIIINFWNFDIFKL